MKSKTGPLTVNIPHIKARLCYPCKHYQSKMLRSGRAPIYRTTCNHPELPTARSFQPQNPYTPPWCPCLKQPEINQ